MIDIKEKKLCCGCSACIQRCPKHCITLDEDEEGFSYPKVDIKLCIECGICEKICPVINQNAERKPIEVYAAINKDEAIRMQSSSGGLFMALAEAMIREGGVVFGARFNEDYEVVHGYTDTIEGLIAFRGSKYVQSLIGDVFKQVETFLKAKRKVMFSGTPCQIAGLRLFLRKEYDHLLLVDIICHGVPSPMVWRKYLEEKKILYSPKSVVRNNSFFSFLNNASIVTGISFRDKNNGWKKYNFVVKGYVSAGYKVSSSKKSKILIRECFTKNAFMKGFLADLYLRPSCYTCPTKELKSGSDITLGDFWGIQNLKPEIDDDKGICALLVNTSKGIEWLNKANVEKITFCYEEVVKGNSALIRSANLPVARNSFFKQIRVNRVEKTINKCLSQPFAYKLAHFLCRIIKLS